MCGDFNARSSIWDQQGNGAQGKAPEEAAGDRLRDGYVHVIFSLQKPARKKRSRATALPGTESRVQSCSCEKQSVNGSRKDSGSHRGGTLRLLKLGQKYACRSETLAERKASTKRDPTHKAAMDTKTEQLR